MSQTKEQLYWHVIEYEDTIRVWDKKITYNALLERISHGGYGGITSTLFKAIPFFNNVVALQKLQGQTPHDWIYLPEMPKTERYYVKIS